MCVLVYFHLTRFNQSFHLVNNSLDPNSVISHLCHLFASGFMSSTLLMSKPYIFLFKALNLKNTWQNRAKDKIIGQANRIFPTYKHKNINYHWFNKILSTEWSLHLIQISLPSPYAWERLLIKYMTKSRNSHCFLLMSEIRIILPLGKTEHFLWDSSVLPPIFSFWFMSLSPSIYLITCHLPA